MRAERLQDRSSFLRFWAVVLPVLFLITASSAAHATVTAAQVEMLWGKVVEAANMDSLPLEIKEDKSPNAWVTAGKSVTVTTGLMKLLHGEDEMFGVLAHEAGHAKLGHYQKRVGNSVGVGLLATILGKKIGGGIGGAAVNAGANLATAGFSREQEVAADDFAVDLAFKAGVDPAGLHSALERISLMGGKTEPSGFNSHPPDERRLRHIRERIHARDADAVIPKIEK